MTIKANEAANPDYREAIAALTHVIEMIDAPTRSLGYAWGLQRGQWGYAKVAAARDELREVRDAMVRAQT